MYCGPQLTCTGAGSGEPPTVAHEGARLVARPIGSAPARFRPRANLDFGIRPGLAYSAEIVAIVVVIRKLLFSKVVVVTTEAEKSRREKLRSSYWNLRSMN